MYCGGAVCSRKKGPEFVAEFFKVLPRAIKTTLVSCDAPTRAKIEKIVDVWENRKVFGNTAGKLRRQIEAVGVGDSGSKPTEKVRQDVVASPPAKRVAVERDANVFPPEVKSLLDRLLEVDVSAQKTKVSQQAYEDVADDHSDVTSSALQSYREALQEEMNIRQGLIDFLSGMVETQRKGYNVALGALSTLPREGGVQVDVATDLHDDGSEGINNNQPGAAEQRTNEAAMSDANEASAVAEKVMSNPAALLELLSSIKGQNKDGKDLEEYDPTAS